MPEQMTIAIGCDDLALDLKRHLLGVLEEWGYAVKDYGVGEDEHTLYPDVALKVAEAVAAGKHERAVLICGTGIGMALTANKVPGVRAAVCHDPYSAERSRKSNNCQVIAFGALVIAPDNAEKLLRVWLDSEYQGGGSTPKVNRLDEIDRQYRGVVV